MILSCAWSLKCGFVPRPSNYILQGLTNWGRTPIRTDLTPDDDSIQITAFIQVCDASAIAETLDISFKLQYKNNANMTSTYPIELTGVPATEVNN